MDIKKKIKREHKTGKHEWEVEQGWWGEQEGRICTEAEAAMQAGVVGLGVGRIAWTWVWQECKDASLRPMNNETGKVNTSNFDHCRGHVTLHFTLAFHSSLTVDFLGDIQIFSIYFHARTNEGLKRLCSLLKVMVNSLMTKKSRGYRTLQT